MFLLGGGGAAADAYSLVVVESDTVQVSALQSVKSDKEQGSVLLVAGCKFPAVFLGKVAFDVFGPPCLTEETLPTWKDERAPSARTSPGHNPGGQFGDKDASPRADVAFSSGIVLSWLSELVYRNR